ncbi:hypothetical protein [Pseudomonas sp. NPDC086251]|uniref:hypothetical protein n=1 Tax=Pseudomonas sp. NPDC086251 TaxID=3364431 RepID=UPI0038327596
MNYRSVWANLINKHQYRLDKDPSLRRDGVYPKAAQLALGEYKLFCFAERLRGQHSIWEQDKPLPYRELLNLYLVNKHHWTLAAVRLHKGSDIFLLLRDELDQILLTDEEATPVRQMTETCFSWQVFELHFQAPD